jgi:hypothetical protein
MIDTCINLWKRVIPKHPFEMPFCAYMHVNITHTNKQIDKQTKIKKHILLFQFQLLPFWSYRVNKLKDRYGEPERGGEWMGADKNSSRRRLRLQQDEHDFQHTSLTHYPSWPSLRSHWSATEPRNQQTTFQAKTHQHAQRKLAWLAACAAPVRPMTCAGQTGDTGQTGG